MIDNQSPDQVIEVRLNGDPHQLPLECTVSSLVKSLPVEPTAVAVELNRTIVARSLHETTIIEPGDHIEVVTIIGGG